MFFLFFSKVCLVLFVFFGCFACFKFFWCFFLMFLHVGRFWDLNQVALDIQTGYNWVMFVFCVLVVSMVLIAVSTVFGVVFLCFF